MFTDKNLVSEEPESAPKASLPADTTSSSIPSDPISAVVTVPAERQQFYENEMSGMDDDAMTTAAPPSNSVTFDFMKLVFNLYVIMKTSIICIHRAGIGSSTPINPGRNPFGSIAPPKQNAQTSWSFASSENTTTSLPAGSSSSGFSLFREAAALKTPNGFYLQRLSINIRFQTTPKINFAI